MNIKDYEKLSKEVSYDLRHAPDKYNLEMDEHGWVSIEQLINSLQKDNKWKTLTETDLLYMIDIAKKKRHEINNGKIRAFYGHSIDQKIIKEVSRPPEILYHGTAKRFLNSIMNKGLLSQNRQYVHLSMDVETALDVGTRHDTNPVILKIKAWEAWKQGVLFYHGNEKVWLSDHIPSEYIDWNGCYVNCTIRHIKPSEYKILEDFLYEAIFVPDGVEPPDRSIIKLPALQVYSKDFGKEPDDYALVAIVDGQIVGAIWSRIMNDYGHIDKDTPSLAIAVYKQYRGLKIGTRLLKEMLVLLYSKGYKAVSLAVQKSNYALHLYQRCGFEVISENDEEYIMRYRL